MKITKTHIDGVLIIEPEVYRDSRGAFFESYNSREMNSILNQRYPFVQDNHSISKKGVLRGLHYQEGRYAQAKMVRVIRGVVQDVIVDIRPESASYGEHLSVELRAEEWKMIYIPRGCAHGFLALENHSEFLYKCDNYYNPKAEKGIRFNDPHLKIQWKLPLDDLILSDKDKNLPYHSKSSS